jgi:hypothetical protein
LKEVKRGQTALSFRWIDDYNKDAKLLMMLTLN